MVTFIGAIFKTVISIYAQDKVSPLPSLEEVLICNQRTTVEEVLIFALSRLFNVDNDDLLTQ